MQNRFDCTSYAPTSGVLRRSSRTSQPSLTANEGAELGERVLEALRDADFDGRPLNPKFVEATPEPPRPKGPKGRKGNFKGRGKDHPGKRREAHR